MNTKTSVSASGFQELLRDAPFRQHHSTIIDAPREEVWDALQRMGWRDLRIGLVLTLGRGLAPVIGDTIIETFRTRARGVYVEERPTSLWLVMVGKPWSLVPQHAHVETVADVEAFHEPGWLRYGMDWVLHDLGDGRTLVETTTLCDPTDAGARRAFGIYWSVVSAGSSVMRLDMFTALRRLAKER